MKTDCDQKKAENKGLNEEEHIKVGLLLHHNHRGLGSIECILQSRYHRTPWRKALLDELGKAKDHIINLRCQLDDLYFNTHTDGSLEENVRLYFPTGSIMEMSPEYLNFLSKHLSPHEIIKHLCCLDPFRDCPHLARCFSANLGESKTLVQQIQEFQTKTNKT